MKSLYWFVGIVIVLSLLFGGWYLKRKINYELLYKNMVQETVREMVKPEALK